MIWFVSDTHFGHRFMTEHRGFASIDMHDEALIAGWNAVVSERDEVWHLGDFSFANAARTREIADKLNGQKRLIPGNHDSDRTVRAAADSGFEIMPPIVRCRFEGVDQKVTLCHYPILSWPNAHHGAWHLHGHCHSTLQAPETTRLDVGVDALGGEGGRLFVLISWFEIVVKMRSRRYVPVDHHIPKVAKRWPADGSTHVCGRCKEKIEQQEHEFEAADGYLYHTFCRMAGEAPTEETE